MKNTFLNGMTPEHFLKHYWNKKPHVFKAAVPEAHKLGNINDFQKMSYNPDFETRMVLEAGGAYPWQAKLGPFKKSDFKQSNLWTLICHNLELCDESFQQLKKNVNFIPEWNFDDIMVTVSNQGSSVGAHIDDYSVFIIQGHGRRRWLMEEHPKHGYHPDLDIRLLLDFNPEIDWILEPGDMLYIPPNVAHHGISLEESISYSIGYKSVRYNQAIVSYAMDLMSALDGQSFKDKKTRKAEDPFLISERNADAIYKDLIAHLSNRKKFNESLLKFLSRPKNEAVQETGLEASEILKILKKSRVKRDPWAKLVSCKTGKNGFQISINQKIYSLKKPEYDVIRSYFATSPLKSFKIRTDHLKNETLANFFVENFKAGVLFSDL